MKNFGEILSCQISVFDNDALVYEQAIPFSFEMVQLVTQDLLQRRGPNIAFAYQNEKTFAVFFDDENGGSSQHSYPASVVFEICNSLGVNDAVIKNFMTEQECLGCKKKDLNQDSPVTSLKSTREKRENI